MLFLKSSSQGVKSRPII
uniref:Uncharacterized protein n=1 Tax=Arundo donax TaxID=35708 RepID=A0A0A9A918_ARUDO